MQVQYAENIGKYFLQPWSLPFAYSLCNLDRIKYSGDRERISFKHGDFAIRQTNPNEA